MRSEKQKIIVILGPTASGKTGLAVWLARKFNGEIVSADSRQVYKGMDVGTGKDLKEFSIFDFRFLSGKNKLKINSEYSGKKLKKIKIPYHLIDVVSPKTKFSLAKYQRLAYKAIDDILSRGKLPILVGGTGLYLQAVVDGYNLSGPRPDEKLRKELDVKSVDELFVMFKKISPKMAARINASDRKNKRRLIRYLEILIKTPESVGKRRKASESEKKYEPLIIGLSKPKKILGKRIYGRLVERLENEDMIGEVRHLHKDGLSWKRLESFGLEYKFVSLYLQRKISYEEMAEKLFIAIRQFAKRQMTWFRRWERTGAKINWTRNRGEAGKLIKSFIK